MIKPEALLSKTHQDMYQIRMLTCSGTEERGSEQGQSHPQLSNFLINALILMPILSLLSNFAPSNRNNPLPRLPSLNMLSFKGYSVGDLRT
jgi:hypothetical protein